MLKNCYYFLMVIFYPAYIINEGKTIGETGEKVRY